MAEYLADVCKNTMWRKKPGRKATRVIEFTATGRDSGGKPIEALGSRKTFESSVRRCPASFT